ncbi:membrane protein insertase YidC [Solwaraspora sp. WMMD406]|uniref:YidC/Oxa1 family membrane protein insertase n=1 Tax=Solwaraspora sp. WMMD406 TaxID=3016095 RepID=UPI002416B4E6|nr:membrane protein insertase YidC [Solwaraspora sp. WMMD406]MDG4767558.1 membrane protein insertase YidC [Solwaraspora sp. WMMD406]
MSAVPPAVPLTPVEPAATVPYAVVAQASDFGPIDTVVTAALDVLGMLAGVLAPVAGSGAVAMAIVVFTVAVRLLLVPLSWLQIRAERRREALAPQLRQLRQRYADQPERLAAETMALYRSNGASPFAGCLPGLLQAPFFLLMYQMVTRSAESGGLDGVLLGVGLGRYPAQFAGPGEALVFGALLAALLVFAWLTSRRSRQRIAAAAQLAGEASGSAGQASGSAGQASGSAGQAEQVTAGLNRLIPWLPYGTVLFALVVPLAAGLYLATTTGWTVLEQVVLRSRLISTTVDKGGSTTYNS